MMIYTRVSKPDNISISTFNALFYAAHFSVVFLNAAINPIILIVRGTAINPIILIVRGTAQPYYTDSARYYPTLLY